MRLVRNAIYGLAVLAILMACVAVTFAGTIRHDQAADAYLALGADPAFACVGRVDFAATDGTFSGSGTLISADWVLTAGHVVDGATSLTFTVGGTTYEAQSWLPHPKWNGDLLAGYDIGLAKLSSPVAGVLPAQRYTDSGEAGSVATIVGYGMTGTGLTGATVYDGQKRAGTNVVDVLTGGSRKDPSLMLTDFDSPLDPGESRFGADAPLDFEFCIAFGDSGGGLFLDSEAGPLLAGVNSFIGAYDGAVDSDYGDIAGYTRVSSFNKWIDKVLRDKGGKGNGRPGNPHAAFGEFGGASVQGAMIPEPATLGLLTMGLLGALRLRRHAK